MKALKTAAFASALALLPTTSLAGDLSSAGVTDPTVVPPSTTTAFVWCPKLEAEVPANLQADLECDDAVKVDTVRPRVAPARFTRGLFGLPAHVPSGTPRVQDDDTPPIPVPAPPTTTVSNDPPSPNTPTPPQTNNPPPITTVSNDPVPDGSTPDKWERLGQLGVTQQNYHQQDQGFLDKVDTYRNQFGSDGDWTNFNP